MFSRLKSRIISLKNDKTMLIILSLHLLLAACHLYQYYLSPVMYHAELRIAGCCLIALLIFFFDRPGMAFGFLVYACCLIYVNTFYNYGTIFFLLIAFGAYPRIKWPSTIIYGINVVVSFSLQHLLPISLLIHGVYLVLFLMITSLIYKVKTPKKLNLKEDEIYILKQLKDGKMQKEIDKFSQQTVTAKLKSARERNMCESTPELLAKFTMESDSELAD